LLKLAQAAVSHQLASEAKVFVASLLAAGLQDSLGAFHGCDKPAAFVDRQRQGLFAIDVFAGFQRGHVDQRMPMVGSSIDDDIDIFLSEQLAEIFEGGRVGPDLLSLVQTRVVEIAIGDEVAMLGRVARDDAPAAATADQGDAWFVVRGERFGGGGRGLLQKPARQRRRSRDCRG
jgi:hypothetical protein